MSIKVMSRLEINFPELKSYKKVVMTTVRNYITLRLDENRLILISKENYKGNCRYSAYVYETNELVCCYTRVDYDTLISILECVKIMC